MAIPLASQRFGSMPEFNPSSDDIKSYFERFENLVALIEVPVTKKLRLFLKVVGNTVYGKLKKILVPDRPTDKTFAEIQEVLQQHYSPEYSVIAERCKFNKRMQKEGECVKVFLTELKHLARNCEFKAFLNDALRDRLMAGLRDQETQRILFITENLTFEKACKTALEKELAAKQTIELHSKAECSTDINAAIMDKVLEGIPNVGCYIDDVIITGHSVEDCYTTATKVLKALSDHNITLKEEKCQFFRDSEVYLGPKVSKEGI
nr:uncharacterized protein LOC119169790 [Rhipicephalus microplus]